MIAVSDKARDHLLKKGGALYFLDIRALGLC
jgi:hypothetical protein